MSKYTLYKVKAIADQISKYSTRGLSLTWIVSFMGGGYLVFLTGTILDVTLAKIWLPKEQLNYKI